MSTYSKPLPVVSEWSKPFWEKAKAHMLTLKKCKVCGHIDHPPYVFCTECSAEEHEWIEASGKATLYTFTTTVLGAPEPFIHDMPFIIAMVDLDEGVRMLTTIVDAPEEDLEIGMQVEVVFDDVTSEVALPRFRPVKKEGAAR